MVRLCDLCSHTHDACSSPFYHAPLTATLETFIFVAPSTGACVRACARVWVWVWVCRGGFSVLHLSEHRGPVILGSIGVVFGTIQLFNSSTLPLQQQSPQSRVGKAKQQYGI